MKSFIVQHIDALITAGGGVLCCLYGYRLLRIGGALTPNQERANRLLRVFGPLLLLFGLLRFCTDGPPMPNWRRHLTTDGVASVEFPGEPRIEEKTESVDGVELKWSSLEYKVPGKEITMILSLNALPPSAAGISDADRFAAMKIYLAKQGHTVIGGSSLTIGAATGYAMELDRDGGKVRARIRCACVDGTLYRGVVSSAGTWHDDPIISHFLESFRIERSVSEPASEPTTANK